MNGGYWVRTPQGDDEGPGNYEEWLCSARTQARIDQALQDKTVPTPQIFQVTGQPLTAQARA